ncbi:MAG: hypothetical protein QXG03_10670, partial [Halalkalicoccus sp.]
MRRSGWFRVVLFVVLLPGLIFAPGVDTVGADEHDDDIDVSDDDGPLPDDEADDDEADDETGVDEEVDNETDEVEEDVENASDEAGVDSGGEAPRPDRYGTDSDDDEAEDDDGGSDIIDRGSDVVGQADPRNLPENLVNYVASWVEEHAASTFEEILEGSVEFAVSTPTMDNDGWMGIFGEPTDDLYEPLYDEIYIGAVSPVVLFLMV